jgi:hypothetical protein
VTDSTPGTPGVLAGLLARMGRREWLIVAAVAVAIVLIVVGAIAAAAGGASENNQAAPGATHSPSGSATPTPGATDTPAPVETGAAAAPAPAPAPTVDPDYGEPVADTVKSGETAAFGDSVSARLISVTPMTVTGANAGEVSGPAIAVELALDNATGATISLDVVTVNAFYGADKTPASPVDSAAENQPFTGNLASASSATGTYVFSVPSGATNIVITVSKSADSPLVVFQYN